MMYANSAVAAVSSTKFRFPIFESVSLQLYVAIGIIITLLVGSASFTLHELNLRKHDYIILNLTGQMRVAASSVVNQAERLLADAQANGATDDAKLHSQWQEIQRQIDLIELIVTSLRERRIEPALTGRNDVIQCTWDQHSRSQMDITALDWANFLSGLSAAQGADPKAPRLEQAARFISLNGAGMMASADHLAQAFQTMMEGKLNDIRLFQLASGVLAALLLLVIAFMAQRRVIAPLLETVAGFSRVAQGDLGHQVPVRVDNEIGRMTQAFNSLSERINALFRLTGRINQGRQLDETLSFVIEEFRSFVPVDWVGVLYAGDDGLGVTLERMAGMPAPGLRDGQSFVMGNNELAEVSRTQRPLLISDLAAYGAANPSAELAQHLSSAGLASALYLPLSSARKNDGAIVFAAKASAAYTADHMEFLGNIAGQIGHILEKTVVVEGLVVAALGGLAKLAESRDPETGDHLVRMALYSAVLAEELGREGIHAGRISAAYVRDVFRFAPMHDIGKVGISDNILLKPGRLSSEERIEMERHPAIGGQALRRCESQMNALGHSIFTVGIEIAECHHEKVDGTGYPAGLAGEEIPLSARIVAVADVFDALTSKRPYKDAWPVERALTAIEEASGQHFDPEVVAALKRALPRVREIYERLRHV